ncbi:MAG: glucose-methanol-choline oxidoreductase [Gammaproteobacteria bacterium]|nr:glucose-methanol-choline oxidoreductase [Gammaproteobacteria bacterium]
MLDSYDIIVIGGGSAGCALAMRLSEDRSRSVLLLEAGRSDKHLFSRIPAASPLAIGSPDFNWMYQIEADPSRNNKVDMWPAGRCLGGGSAINGMMFIRSHPYDFQHWLDLGNTGWGFDDVLPYFKRMENNERGEDTYRGRHGPQAVSEVRCPVSITDKWIEAAQEAGIPRSTDLNGEIPEGLDYCQLSQKNGLRHSTAHAYIWPELKKRKNLTVQLNAEVQRVICENGRARAVEYTNEGKTKRVAANAGVVISAGALASPKLLMLSGYGDGEQLHEHGIDVLADLPGVGQNLQEHPAMNLEIRVKLPTLSSDQGPFRNILHGMNFLFRRRGPLTTSIGHAHALVHTRSDLPAPNIQIILTPFSFQKEGEKITLSKEPELGFAIGLMRPRSRGQIRLRSALPNDKPIIEHQMFGENEDLKELLEGFQMARKIIHQECFKPYLVHEKFPGNKVESSEELETIARESAFPMYHPVGSCKMGQDEMAVVDHNLKVRQTENLWVADTSIMPTLTSGNTNATAIMIGERASALINEQLNK